MVFIKNAYLFRINSHKIAINSYGYAPIFLSKFLKRYCYKTH
ncbi:hypothetical protein HMPREF1404_00079 [Helicobacter pylori GAM210Bi]|nr:hypothetical protein HMPREF1404_00079 [Helicobacter pylori GAM210Bi]